MVTLLSPKQDKSNTAYEEPEGIQIGLVNHSQNNPAKLVIELSASPQPLTEAEHGGGVGKRNFWASIVRPLSSLRELLAGPLMTERDRNRQTLADANARNAAALNWFYRTPF
jgi:hypothetical protein